MSYELSCNPTLEEIKINFKRLVKQYHPDRNQTPEALEYMKKINKAYAIATNKEPIPQQALQLQPQRPVVIIRYGFSGFNFYSFGSSTSTGGWW